MVAQPDDQDGLTADRPAASWPGGQAPERRYRPPRSTLSSDEWRDKVAHLYDQMPAQVQQRIVRRLIHDQPRVFYMTIVSLLDSDDDGDQDQERSE